MLEIEKLSENIYRVRGWEVRRRPEALTTKYRLLNAEPDGKPERIYFGESDTAVFENGYRLVFTLTAGLDGGFSVTLPLAPEDRLFGLGDESRNVLEKRGTTAVIKQENVRSYGPIPYLMSSRGWAIAVNCTYVHTFDIGASDPDTLRIFSDKGALDFFVFTGTGLRDALYLSGKVIGRPVMLPKFAYGLTFVMNEQAEARTLLDDSLRFHDRQIPCDCFSLEPKWMETSYDFTTKKKWSSERFYLPFWLPENYYGDFSFIWNLNQMGRKLSLWLCCRYDLLWKEEDDVFRDPVQDNSDAAINDPRLTSGCRLDDVTVPGEAWFEHLKKFVDNGAEAFKLDGSQQVIPFPDRVWAGRYLDDEVRNVYPLIYAKQMKEGFEEHTGRRAMIFTSGSYIGIQKYAATWAGDTGCSLGVLMSLMNFAMCGHSNASFDMTCEDRTKIHIGFLAPWTEHLCWDNWMYPWYGKPALENCYRYYSQLRSSLFPYLYSYAHVANETSLTLLRPLALQYPDTDRYDRIYNEYMLGDSFLISAFDRHLVLPEEDEWYDFFTGKQYRGPKEFDYELPEERGGAIFVRAGSIIVRQDWADSLTDHDPDVLEVHVYPGKDASFVLYEDDYTTYGYEKGEVAKTEFFYSESDGRLTVGRRTGSYPGMKKEKQYRILYHDPDGGVREG